MSSMDDDVGSAAAHGDAGAAAASASCFTQLQEMPLTSEVSICSWCPTMDLCAVVSTDGQLHLHRLNWQLLWAVVPDAQITAVAWRPDGKIFAAGHQDGGISIYDVETGEVRARHKAHYASIMHLAWLEGGFDNMPPASSTGKQQQATSLQHQQQPLRHKQLFLPPAPGAATGCGAAGAGVGPHGQPSQQAAAPGAAAAGDVYASIMQQAAAEQAGAHGVAAGTWPAEPKSLDLMMVVDSRGRVSIWAHGDVQLVDAAAPGWRRVGVEAAGEEEEASGPGRVLGVTATAELDLAIFVQQHSQGGLLLHASSLQLLHRHRHELQRCAALFGVVQEQLAGAHRALTSAAREWRSAMSDLGRRMEQLASDLADAGAAAPNPIGDLTLLLCSGSITQGLQQFLLTTLGEAGLRRLARQVDLAADALHAALLSAIAPRVSLAVFALGEMRGLVAAECGLQRLGLQPHEIEALEVDGIRTLLRAERLRLVTCSVAGQYRCFFSWLLRVLRMLDTQGSVEPEQQGYSGPTPSPEQMRDIRALLKGQLQYDTIGPELRSTPMDDEAQEKSQASLRGSISRDECEQLLQLLFPCRPDSSDTLPAGLNPHSSSSHSSFPAATMPAAAAAMAEDDQSAAAAAARARPLIGLLQHLSDQVEAAFERPQQIASASMAPVLQLQLVPPLTLAPDANPGSSGVAAGAGARAGAAASGGGLAGLAVRVSTASPLLQQKDAADRGVGFACCIPAGAAVGGLQARREHVLLVRLLQEQQAHDRQHKQRRQQQQGLEGVDGGQGAGSGVGVAAEACLLAVPSGCKVVDACLYREHRLAVLTQEEGADAATLALVNVSDAPWTSIPGLGTAPSATELCIQAAAQQGDTGGNSGSGGSRGCCCMSSLPSRKRCLGTGAMAPLAVSRQRGLACVVSDVMRAAVFDLEEDEEEEGEDEEEGEEEEEGADMEVS